MRRVNVRLSGGAVLAYDVPDDVEVGDAVVTPPVGWWTTENGRGVVIDEPVTYQGPCKRAWADQTVKEVRS